LWTAGESTGDGEDEERKGGGGGDDVRRMVRFYDSMLLDAGDVDVGGGDVGGIDQYSQSPSSYLSLLERALDFLQAFVRSSPHLHLGIHTVRTIWTTLVERAVTRAESDLLFGWTTRLSIMREDTNTNLMISALPEGDWEQAAEVQMEMEMQVVEGKADTGAITTSKSPPGTVTQILSYLLSQFTSPSRIASSRFASLTAVRCVERIWVAVNARRGALVELVRSFALVDVTCWTGVDLFWQILLTSPAKTVSDHLGDFLVFLPIRAADPETSAASGEANVGSLWMMPQMLSWV